jgi:precorrin-6A/cobalt-precorrin-6A reductase
MILLIGGTSETAPLASALADAGLRVLVSTATDVTLDLGCHPNVMRRTGVLDQAGLRRLIDQQRIRLIVDASHPYAVAVRDNARRVAAELGIPYLNWLRPAGLESEESVIFCQDHKHAAETACSFGLPVLLTTGSRNLVPYAAASRRAGIELVVRVLPHADSLDACRAAGVTGPNIITGRGPFSVEENLETMRRFNIGVMVTKDSGTAGGVPAKLEAARIHACRVVVVQRPEDSHRMAFSDVSRLVAAVLSALSPKPLQLASPES